MTKDFKNVLYFILIIVLCIALPFFIPQLSILFYSFPLIQLLLVFFATQFAKGSRLTGLITSAFMLGYVYYIVPIIMNYLTIGLFNYLIIAFVLAIVVFICEYAVSRIAKGSMMISLRFLGWLLLAFFMNIVLSIFLPILLMNLR